VGRSAWLIYVDGKNGRYTYANLGTGEQRWTVRRRDRFVMINELGDRILAQRSPAGYKEINLQELPESRIC
jgi:hypothetical protein